MKRFLIIQTAFLGDVILTLPLVQVLKREFAESVIDVVAIPETADVLVNHPAVSNVVLYDKHGKHKSLMALLHFRNRLREGNYDVVICPHRSLRSAILAGTSNAKMRIGFDMSAASRFFTHRLPWKFGVHEVERNLSLLGPVLAANGKPQLEGREMPELSISEKDRSGAERFLVETGVKHPFAVVAPGTVWRTKQYPLEMMIEVVRGLLRRFNYIVILGGKKDSALESSFRKIGNGVVVAIGKLSIMSSAEVIRNSSLLVANDSAPVHIASAFDVPTAAVFGPTVKDFGFYPYHSRSVVIEVEDLGCRPCSIHGGKKCPIGTFECMIRISPDEIIEKAVRVSETIQRIGVKS